MGGDFTKIGGVSAPKIAMLDLATGTVVKTFKSLVKGRVFSIALSGNRLFVGGDFTQVEKPDAPSGYTYAVAVPADGSRVYVGDNFLDLGGQGGMVVLDGATGALDPWNPKADAPTGPYSVAVGDDHVFVGGEFNKINGAAQPGFAQFALPSSTTATTVKPQTSPTTATTRPPTTTTTQPAPTTTTTRSWLGSLLGV